MSLFVFILTTMILFGFASWMTGRAIAYRWRSIKYLVFYIFLISIANQFINYALFEYELLSLKPFLIQLLALLLISLTSYQFYHAHIMVSQYPWIYQKKGIFSWKEIQKND